MPRLSKKIRDRRVAVALDVLAQIRARRLRPANLGYVNPVNALFLKDALYDALQRDDADLQEVVDVVTSHCHVCVRGAVLLSKARLYDDVPLHRVIDEFGGPACSQPTTTDILADTFDAKTLVLMECAFELTDLFDRTYLASNKSRGDAVKFGKLAGPVIDRTERPTVTARDARRRVIAVMNNLIANEGQFDPTQPPDIKLPPAPPKKPKAAKEITLCES